MLIKFMKGRSPLIFDSIPLTIVLLLYPVFQGYAKNVFSLATTARKMLYIKLTKDFNMNFIIFRSSSPPTDFFQLNFGAHSMFYESKRFLILIE